MPDYTPYVPANTVNLVGAWDAAAFHGALTDGQSVNQALPDLSGNNLDILPSALATTGLPIYHELDLTTGTGRGYAYAPRIHMSGKNALITPPGVRTAIGSGDCTVLLITVVPVYGSGNFSLFGFCNGDAYRTGTGTITPTGSIGVNAAFEGGNLRLKRTGSTIGDYGIAPDISKPTMAHPFNRYKCFVARRTAGVWTISRDGLPCLAPASGSTDPTPANPLLDLSFGYAGDTTHTANEDFLYGAIYSRALTDDEINTFVLGFSLARLDMANIFGTGNSIMLGYGLSSADRPTTLLSAAYNESQSDRPAYLTSFDVVTGRPYHSMPKSYATAQNPWGNIVSPLRGRTLILIEEETNEWTQAPAGSDIVAVVRAARESVISQYKSLTHVTVGISSMKPRQTLSEATRTALRDDLIAHVASLNAQYGNRFFVIDSGADSQIGIAGAQNNGSLYQPDKTHETAAGALILTNGYYLTAISGWIGP